MISVARFPDAKVWSNDLLPGGLGWFWWDTPEDDFGPMLVIRCPHGHFATLSLSKHAVAADGTVSPSIWFKDICDFHDHGRLEGWTAADAERLATTRR